MIEQLIKEWQSSLENETDTSKYRLIVQTIAFLQSVQSTRQEQDNNPLTAKVLKDAIFNTIIYQGHSGYGIDWTKIPDLLSKISR
jgi:hypothetical protein